MTVAPPDDRQIRALVALGDATVDWCVRRGEMAARRADQDGAAEWARFAAEVARRTPASCLSSARLERLLVTLSPAEAGSRVRRSAARPRTWLHVLTTSYAIGGHTALVRRWIEAQPGGERHDLLLTDQAEDTVEAGLRAAVHGTRGRVHSVAHAGSAMAQALAIRRAAADADVVLLAIHPWDVAPVIAFADRSGPPVLFVNHDDHAFWIGTGAADVVVDIRTSGAHLTRTYRRARSNVEVPLPIPDAGRAARPRGEHARCTLLTIGRAPKYVSAPGLDFFRAAHRVLTALPGADLVGVGPSPEDVRWQALAAAMEGRAIAVGEQTDLRPWHERGDLYLEGFPVGSYTALLEAALAGLPVVRKPFLVSPNVLPVDGGALAHIPVAADEDEYVNLALALAGDPAARAAAGEANRRAVLARHCGEAWRAELAALADAVPREHAPVVPGETPPVPYELAAYWARYRQALGAPDPFRFAFTTALARRLRPLIDGTMRRALSEARHAGVPSVAPFKGWLGSHVLAGLPRRAAERVYLSL